MTEALSAYSIIDARSPPQPPSAPPPAEADQAQTRQLVDYVAQLEDAARQQEEQGFELEAMRSMEQVLAFRRDLHKRGACGKAELHATAEQLAVKYNTLGVRAFKRDSFEDANAILRRSLQLTDTEAGAVYFEGADVLRLRLRATTLNNLGCMERRRGALDRALEHTLQAAGLEGNSSAATNLNVAAILTQLGRHPEAIGAARRAIGLLQQRRQHGGQMRPEEGPLLAIAYHNLGMAQEHSLSPEDRTDAVESYAIAHQTAITELGTDHETTQTVARSLQRCREAAQAPPPAGPRPRGRGRRSLTNAPAPSGSSRLPPISRSPMVSGMQDGSPDASPPPELSPQAHSAAVFGMMTAEQLQQEMNPSYTGETGVVLVDRQQQQPQRERRRPRPKVPRAPQAPPPRSQHAPEPPPQRDHREAPRRPPPQPDRRMPEPAVRRPKAAAPTPPAPPPVRRRQRQREPKSPGADEAESDRPQRGADRPKERPQPPPQPPAQRAPRQRHNARDDAKEKARSPQPERTAVPQRQQPRGGTAQQRLGSGGAVATARSQQQRADDGEAAEGPSQQQDRREPTSAAADGAAARRPQQPAVDPGQRGRPRPRDGDGDGAEQTASAPARGRRGDDRDEERKKEDAVGYMHALLVRLLKDEDVFELRFQAALRIQCLARVTIARRTVVLARATRHSRHLARLHHENDAARTVTRFVRGVADRHRKARWDEERAREEWARRHAAAIRIQTTARGWLARNKAVRRRQYYQRIHWAVRVLQCFFRRSLARAEVRRRRGRRDEAIPRRLRAERLRRAATLIQKVWRGCFAREQTHAMRGRLRRQRQLDGDALRKHSATVIAACWRGHAGRKIARRRSAERHIRWGRDDADQARKCAASQIQAAFRAYVGRKRARGVMREHRERLAKSVAAKRHAAAITVQCMFRCTRSRLARAVARQARADAHNAGRRDYGAVSMQSLYRGFRARKQTAPGREQARRAKELLQQEMDEAAARMQAARGQARAAERERRRQEEEEWRRGAVRPMPQPGQEAAMPHIAAGGALLMLLDAAGVSGVGVPSLQTVAACGQPDTGEHHAYFRVEDGPVWSLNRVPGGGPFACPRGAEQPRLEVTAVAYDVATRRMCVSSERSPADDGALTLARQGEASALKAVARFCGEACVPCELDAFSTADGLWRLCPAPAGLEIRRLRALTGSRVTAVTYDSSRCRMACFGGASPVWLQLNRRTAALVVKHVSAVCAPAGVPFTTGFSNAHGKLLRVVVEGGRVLLADDQVLLPVIRPTYDVVSGRLAISATGTPQDVSAMQLDPDVSDEAVAALKAACVDCSVDAFLDSFVAADRSLCFLKEEGGRLWLVRNWDRQRRVNCAVYDTASRRLAFSRHASPHDDDALQLQPAGTDRVLRVLRAACEAAGVPHDLDRQQPFVFTVMDGGSVRIAPVRSGAPVVTVNGCISGRLSHAVCDLGTQRLWLQGTDSDPVRLVPSSMQRVLSSLAAVCAAHDVPHQLDSFEVGDGSTVNLVITDPDELLGGIAVVHRGKQLGHLFGATCDVATRALCINLAPGVFPPFAEFDLPSESLDAVLARVGELCRAAGAPHRLDTFGDTAGSVWEVKVVGGHAVAYRDGEPAIRITGVSYDVVSRRLQLQAGRTPADESALQIAGDAQDEVLRRVCAICATVGVPHTVSNDPRAAAPPVSRPTAAEVGDVVPPRELQRLSTPNALPVMLELAGEIGLQVPALSSVVEIIADDRVAARTRPSTRGRPGSSRSGSTQFVLPLLVGVADELGCHCPALAAVMEEQTQADVQHSCALIVQCAVRRWRAIRFTRLLRDAADAEAELHLRNAAAVHIQKAARGYLVRAAGPPRRGGDRHSAPAPTEQLRDQAPQEQPEQAPAQAGSAPSSPPKPSAPSPQQPQQLQERERVRTAAESAQTAADDAKMAARMARRERELRIAQEDQRLRDADAKDRADAERMQMLTAQRQEQLQRRAAEEQRMEAQMEGRRRQQRQNEACLGWAAESPPRPVLASPQVIPVAPSPSQASPSPKPLPQRALIAPAPAPADASPLPFHLQPAVSSRSPMSPVPAIPPFESPRSQQESLAAEPTPPPRPEAVVADPVAGMHFNALRDAETVAEKRTGTRERQRRVHAGAMTIQRFARSTAARVEFKRRRQLVHAARVMEDDMARQQEADRVEAANRIQGIQKVRKAKKEKEARLVAQEGRIAAAAERDMKRAENEAATRIQCQVRSKIARCDREERRRQRDSLLEQRKQEEVASTEIQRIARGRQARKEAQERRESREQLKRQREQRVAAEVISPTTAQRLGLADD